MAIVRVTVERYRGEYTLDAEVPMTSLEWRWIKKISGYLPMTVEDGFAGDDPDLYLALAIVAMYRAGKIRKEEALTAALILEAAPFDHAAISIDFSDESEKADLAEEETADPPA